MFSIWKTIAEEDSNAVAPVVRKQLQRNQRIAEILTQYDNDHDDMRLCKRIAYDYMNKNLLIYLIVHSGQGTDFPSNCFVS